MLRKSYKDKKKTELLQIRQQKNMKNKLKLLFKSVNNTSWQKNYKLTKKNIKSVSDRKTQHENKKKHLNFPKKKNKNKFNVNLNAFACKSINKMVLL